MMAKYLSKTIEVVASPRSLGVACGSGMFLLLVLAIGCGAIVENCETEAYRVANPDECADTEAAEAGGGEGTAGEGPEAEEATEGGGSAEVEPLPCGAFDPQRESCDAAVGDCLNEDTGRMCLLVGTQFKIFVPATAADEAGDMHDIDNFSAVASQPQLFPHPVTMGLDNRAYIALEARAVGAGTLELTLYYGEDQLVEVHYTFEVDVVAEEDIPSAG